MPRGTKARPEPAAAAGTAGDRETIAQVIGELLDKQRRLGELVDRALAKAELRSTGAVSVGTDAGAGLLLPDAARLLALYAQNASRLGRLLRDQQALAGAAGGALPAAIDEALDALSRELGIAL